MISHPERQAFIIDVHTESTSPVLVKDQIQSILAKDRFYIPHNADRAFSIILQKITGEPLKTDTAVDYGVNVIFGWGSGRSTVSESAGNYINITGVLRKNMSDFTNDVYFPEYFQIQLTPSANTPSDIRVIVTIL